MPKLIQWGQDLDITSESFGNSEHWRGKSLLVNRTDDGEDVSYTVELIVFDYTIAPYIELTDV